MDATPVSTGIEEKRGRRSLPFAGVSLVFQGGGALGAYQAGVFQAIHEANIEATWICGTSIGAINGALIVGNPPANGCTATRTGTRHRQSRRAYRQVEPAADHKNSGSVNIAAGGAGSKFISASVPVSISIVVAWYPFRPRGVTDKGVTRMRNCSIISTLHFVRNCGITKFPVPALQRVALLGLRDRRQGQ